MLGRREAADRVAVDRIDGQDLARRDVDADAHDQRGLGAGDQPAHLVVQDALQFGVERDFEGRLLDAQFESGEVVGDAALVPGTATIARQHAGLVLVTPRAHLQRILPTRLGQDVAAEQFEAGPRALLGQQFRGVRVEGIGGVLPLEQVRTRIQIVRGATLGFDRTEDAPVTHDRERVGRIRVAFAHRTTGEATGSSRVTAIVARQELDLPTRNALGVQGIAQPLGLDRRDVAVDDAVRARHQLGPQRVVQRRASIGGRFGLEPTRQVTRQAIQMNGALVVDQLEHDAEVTQEAVGPEVGAAGAVLAEVRETQLLVQEDVGAPTQRPTGAVRGHLAFGQAGQSHEADAVELAVPFHADGGAFVEPIERARHRSAVEADQLGILGRQPATFFGRLMRHQAQQHVRGIEFERRCQPGRDTTRRVRAPEALGRGADVEGLDGHREHFEVAIDDAIFGPRGDRFARGVRLLPRLEEGHARRADGHREQNSRREHERARRPEAIAVSCTALRRTPSVLAGHR